MNEKSTKYQKQVLHPFLFSWGMLKRLPSVVFWGIKIKALDQNHCEVVVPFSWRTQNPFQSTYFAALLGAAELSTGALCQMLIKGRGDFSMLVVSINGEFLKKASSSITFSCDQGDELAGILDSMTQKGDSATLEMSASGRNSNGDIVAKCKINWSFKRR